jgi:hypothetical protein
VVRQQRDFSLVRAVPIKGKVTQDDGKAVATTRVDFWSPALKLPEGVRFPRPTVTGADGSFKALLPPGDWHVVVNSVRPDYLCHKLAADRLTGPAKAANDAKATKAGAERFVYPDGWTAFTLKAGEASHEVAVTLRPAPRLRGRLIGPDGKTVTRGRVICVSPCHLDEGSFAVETSQIVRRVWLDYFGTLPDPARLGTLRRHGSIPDLLQVDVKDGTFAFPARNPEETYRLLFLDATAKLGAIVELPGKRAGGEPLTVPLPTCGTVQARCVDPQGKPLSNLQVHVWLLPLGEAQPAAKAGDPSMEGATWVGQLDPERYGKALFTDREGRFALPALVAGARYRITLGDGKAHDFRVRAGEVLTLPDLTVNRPTPKDAPQKTKVKQ